MKIIFLFSAIGAGAVTVTLFLLFSVFAVATQDYGISVDPIKDNEGQTNTARVMITNIGKLPLTNIVVNYGSGKVDKLASLSPGEKRHLYFAMNSLCYIIWHIIIVDKLNCMVAIAEHGIDEDYIRDQGCECCEGF